MIEITCKNCGKRFSVRNYRIKQGVKYCSRSCTAQQNPIHKKVIKRNYGEHHPNWKGGRVLRKDGYVLVQIQGKRYFEHRYLVEQKLGRELTTKEQIHHINGIKSDNRIENLIVVDISEHTKMEHKLGTFNEHHLKSRKFSLEPLICQWCNCSYWKQKSYKTRRFCSNDCKNKWMSKYFRIHNPQFKTNRLEMK